MAVQPTPLIHKGTPFSRTGKFCSRGTVSNNSSVCERVDFVRYSPEHYHISWIGMGAVVKNKAFGRFVCRSHCFCVGFGVQYER